MKLKRVLMSLVIGLSLMAAFTACESPTDYTVYGILYTDQTMSTPLADARVDFIASDFETKGYVTTNAEGKFAFFFWDDGNGNGQESNTRKDGELTGSTDSTELIVTQPVTLVYGGKVLFSAQIEREQYTKSNPLLLYPGCYTGKEGRDE